MVTLLQRVYMEKWKVITLSIATKLQEMQKINFLRNYSNLLLEDMYVNFTTCATFLYRPK